MTDQTDAYLSQNSLHIFSDNAKPVRHPEGEKQHESPVSPFQLSTGNKIHCSAFFIIALKILLSLPFFSGSALKKIMKTTKQKVIGKVSNSTGTCTASVSAAETGSSSVVERKL